MYTNQHTRRLERYLFVPLHVGSFSTSLSLSLPSVCSQCQPVISPCKVSVVRSPCVWILLSSQTLGKRGGGANSLCFICQVCCCYATHFRVKVKSQEMQPECCDFIYQLNQFVCFSARAAAQKWWEGWCNLFIYLFSICVFSFMLILSLWTSCPCGVSVYLLFCWTECKDEHWTYLVYVVLWALNT